MASFRAFLIILTLMTSFAVAAPLQWLLARRRSAFADRIPILFCRTLLRILRVSVDVAGHRAATGPLLLVVNHVSWIDVLVLGSLMPFCFLAKREVASWPILSVFARVQGTVFVDRRRRRGIPPANHAMAERLSDGRVVLLFPEGTTFEGSIPGPFFSSHFAAARDFLRAQGAADATVPQQVMIQPTALAYSSAVAAWVGDEALVPHLWRVLRGAPMRCRVSFGEPIPFRRDSDRKIIARASRQSIVAMLATVPAGRGPARHADAPGMMVANVSGTLRDGRVEPVGRGVT